MKQFYLLLFSFISYVTFSQNFTDTKGELQISASGTATYTLPIAIPPSIKNVAPTINLTYSSGVRGGIAGQGWSINSISAISRIATRRDIDGFVDGVDFDDNDKLSLDGQRLLLKTGTYWAVGSTYETEYKSNTKIELKIENGNTILFVVTAPDGSRSWYGSSGSGTYQNSVSVNSWYIVRYEDVYGNFINYNYKTITYNSTNQLYIDTIVFSGNTIAGIATQDKIVFNYVPAQRIERDYMKGTAVYATQILKSIAVYANNSPFRTYKLLHTVDDLGYERVQKLYEVNAQNEESNPVVFEYNTTPTSTTRIEKSYTNNLAFDQVDLAGDFDGDGRMDFAANNQVYTNLFKNNTGNTPVSLSFTGENRQKFVATTLTNGKINQFQSIVFADETASQINFKIYNLNPSGSGFPIGSTKIVNFNNNYTGYQSDLNYQIDAGVDDGSIFQDCTLPAKKQSIEYVEGDFNGDGISEVLITNKTNEKYYYVTKTRHSADPKYFEEVYNEEYGYWSLQPVYEIVSSQCEVRMVDDGNKEFYLLNLDTNASTTLGSSGYLKLANDAVLIGDKRIVADFNGDGKSDVFVINNNGTYKIICFKQLTVSPWVELEVIGSGTLDQYSSTKQILLGDYNGDGKTDIMLPTSEGGEGQTQWNIYYANPKPAGGDFFTKEIQNIAEYWPDTGSHYKTQRHWRSYYAMDINGDGKSDLVMVRREYYKEKWTINDHNTMWEVTAYTNNIGKNTGSGFSLTYDSGAFNSNSPEVPIPITSNYRYQGANTDLVIVRGHYNWIEYYQFNKDLDTDNRLKSVTESSGNIKQTIDYLPMEASDYKLGLVTDFYSSANAVTYPNIEIIRNSNSYLVSKLTATINNVSKYQDFRYRGLVSNYNYGMVGFTRTTRSSWYLLDSDPKIWTTQNNDVTLRGANTITWASTLGSTVFAATPTNLISTKTNVFATYTNPTSKVYNVLLSSQTSLDALSGIKSESTYTYDGLVNAASYYGLETKRVTKQYSGVTLQGTTTVDTKYDSNTTGTDYYIGRPKQVNTSANNVTSNDTRTSEEIYTYTDSNLTKTEKKGHNTYAIVEDMTYDAVGNLLTKTVSAPDAPVAEAVTSRTIKDEYDTTKRFVVKKTDHQNFVTNFTYNTLGQVKYSKDYMGVVSDFTYDNWGKLLTTTVSNASVTPIVTAIVYAKLADGGYTTTTTNNQDAKTIVQYDVLGRVVISTTKGFATNSLISKQVVYDGLGRKQKESEPYFSSPGFWTAYEYDYLMRPTKITAPTGKIQTLTYSGLTTTSIDDGKTTTATVDALGNKTQTTDPGGAITFMYYANGQLKESNYLGNKIEMKIDGWGNKIELTDPSAGTYTYSYDAFGQLKNETTPNGTTAFIYDDAGRTTDKTINGTGTDSKTTYTYNAFNQPTSSTYTDNLESKTTTNTYEYDNLKRAFKTTETTPYATFIKSVAFDNLGRIDKETSTATAYGKTSAKTVKNVYQNGFLWKILDNTNQQVLWQTSTVNERGQLLTALLGNGITITNDYDIYGYLNYTKHDLGSVNVMNHGTSFTTKRGNLSLRTNSLFGQNETFDYDAQDRLTKITANLSLVNNTFSTADPEGYQTEGGATMNSSGGQLVIQGTASGATVKKILSTEAVISDVISVIFSFQKVQGTDAYNIYIQEENPSDGNVVKYLKKAAVNGIITFTHTVTQYSTISLRIEKVNTTAINVCLIDNVVATKTQILTQDYDDKGRIAKNNLGTYEYDGTKTYRNKSISATLDAISYYTVRHDQNISYNTFKSPVLIEDVGIDKISFTYNDGNDRSSMFYGGLQDDKLLRTYRKHYSADGTMEVKQNTVTGVTEFVTYIGGDGYSAPVVLKSDGTTQNYLYLHRDYQGTIVAITNQAGTVVEKRLFDAWGNIVKVQDGSGNILAGLTVLDRGYTGHEHLQSVGLIHMNGRLYDPKLHRFLQPDNYVQQPENTQNYNKYGYCLNNPLKYTDPSGEIIPFLAAVAIGAAVSALTYTLTALLADVPFSIGGLAKATFIGAASAAVTFGIGSACSTITNFYVRAAVSAVVHGTFQGGMTAISGGKFWSGFAAGALSSIASSAWQGGGSTSNYHGAGSFANSGGGMIAFGTVAGGVGAKLTGGNFWQGAVTGLFVSGLNHFAHKAIVRGMIYDRLKTAGIEDPYAEASYAGLSLEEFGLKVFPDLMKLANNPEFEKKETIDSKGSLGLTPVASNDLTGEQTFRGPVQIARASFRSYMQLASTIGHELNHVIDCVNGNMTAWFRHGGEEYRSAMTESNAYNWVSINRGYYDAPTYADKLHTVRLYNKLFNCFK
ncbi:RHS repeat-associated core domain-containing protein [Flavobacterium aquicola]|uniref:RHS repeat-associated protein n=1 Tax=Flavobacterium aquicola TaxID=1682742 RepID=A0A3E0EIA4_9FLAO|nr:RHS repeat-associated core domain-containing protein [Flavobacterium aquicola]REG97997.1 RHS repeat-associated protein [Flavobacterium aquicola]